MRFGLPWQVKGIHEAAEAAARRTGSFSNEWRSTATLQPEAGDEFRPQTHATARNNDRGDDFSRLQLRLDDLTRRIEQIVRSAPANHAPQPRRYDAGRIAEQVDRLEQHLHEIALRHHAPDDEDMPAGPAASALSLEGLEEQIRRITGQIETLKRPSIEHIIGALRAELADIGRALNDALPRDAIATLEMQIQVLAHRIAEGREAGADGRVLAAIENGLAEVRDALNDLMPAETLIGYNEAIKALTQKIDLIVADRNPATTEQLERSIDKLREMSAHVASNDAVSRLSAQVQALADKIDGLAIGARPDVMVGNLESRIDALSRALAERTQIETAMPQRLEALVQTLLDKIGQLQATGSGDIAARHLEDRIVGLMQRLDASDSRLNKLDAIERGLADLLVHIEELRATGVMAANRAEEPGIIGLTQDIAYTRKSLDAVHKRLSDIFDRLDTVEKAKGSEPPKSEASHGDNFAFAAIPSPAIVAAMPAPTHDMTVVQDDPVPPSVVRTSVPSFAPTAPPVAGRPAPAVVVSAPPLDQPLEPGSGPPRRAVSPTLRIAASEAALGGARPAATASASKSNFIAAARRAAQAAHEQGGRAARPDVRKAESVPMPARSRVARRAKSALLAASIVAIIAGSFQFVSNVFDFSIFDTIESRLAAHFDSDAPGRDADETDPATVAAIPDDEPETADARDGAPHAEPRSTDVIAGLLSSQGLPSLTPAPDGTTPSFPNLGQHSLLAPPALSGPPATPAPGGEVTGSVVQAPTAARKEQIAAPQLPAATERLPTNIGSPRLRSAALGGDAAAAYEVAMRFVEGRGVSANLDEAARWFERAASKGLAPAQFRYASMLEKGQGVKKDLAAAQKLYIAAASKGHAKAMHNLAVIYAEGAAGKPDYTSAAQWFRKAAEHGVADSQYNLGVLAARGLGTERNVAESYKWFALAAAQGDKEAARKRDEVAAQLDAHTLAAAQQAVKAFVPAPQPAEAISVTAPPGGWDRTTQPTQEKRPAAGPISLSAFTSGKL